MGIFGGKKKAQARPKDIWITDAVQQDKIYAKIEEIIQSGKPLIIVAFFADTGLRLIKGLEERGVKVVESAVLPVDRPRPQEVVIVPAMFLNNSDAHDAPAQKDSDAVEMLFIELSPYQAEEAMVLSCAEGLSYPITITHYISLDDPLMGLFVSDAMKGMMHKLGMDSESPICSKMIDSAIVKAQKKIGAAAGTSPLAATNAAEWLKINTE